MWGKMTEINDEYCNLKKCIENINKSALFLNKSLKK